MVGRWTTAKFRSKTCLLYTPALFSFRHHIKQPEKGVFKNSIYRIILNKFGQNFYSLTRVCAVVAVRKLEPFGIRVNIYFALKVLQTYTYAF
jgi:hypothetical protein